MSLIQTLRDAHLLLRKQAFSSADSRLYATLLGTVIGEACKLDKEPNDESTLKTLKKFAASITETIAAFPTENAKKELEFLSGYIPAELSEEDTLEHLTNFYGNRIVEEINVRNMKAIKQAFVDAGLSVNGATLAKVVKEYVVQEEATQ